MKKVSLYVMAILAFVFLSCNKESESVNDAKLQPEGFVISAFFDEQDSEATDVKTVYTDEGTSFSFAWQENDVIAVQLYTGGDSSSPNQIKFKASSDGAVSLFHQDGSTFDLTTNHNVEGYSNKNFTLGDYAFYPKEGKGVDTWKLNYSHNSKTVSLASSVDYVDDNPTSVIPLIGKKQDGDGTPNAEYAFRTATGAIKLHINNIPYSATKIVLTSKNTEDVLSAVWTFNQDNANTVYTNGLTMATANSSKSYSKTINLSNLSDQDKDFYIPIPIGTIHGFTLQIFSGSTLQFTKSTSKEIEITRARVTVLPEFTVSEWVPLGTAKFMDVKTFTEENHDSFVNVPLQESTTTKGKYRLVDPYGALYVAKSKDKPSSTSEYFEFTIVPKGETVKWGNGNDYSCLTAVTSNQIAFGYYAPGSTDLKIKTGQSSTAAFFVHPNYSTGYDASEGRYTTANNRIRNRVLAYQDSGIPALVRLCPKYDSGANAPSEDYPILITFPGCDDYAGIDIITPSSVSPDHDEAGYHSWGDDGKEALTDYILTTDNFWHTPNIYGLGEYGECIDIDLGEGKTLTSFVVNCLTRDNNNGRPAKIKLAAKANSGDSWTDLSTTSFTLEQSGRYCWLSIAYTEGNVPYRYIRVGIVSVWIDDEEKYLTSNSYWTFTALTEIELYGK